MVTCLPEEAHKLREWLWLKRRGEKKMKKTIARLWKATIVSVFFEWCGLRIKKEMRLTS